MTTKKITKSAALKSKRMRKILELQVREYIANYHPELRDASVEIGPGNTIARVRRNARDKSQ